MQFCFGEEWTVILIWVCLCFLFNGFLIYSSTFIKSRSVVVICFLIWEALT